jgi:DNA polymerase elongation subunit (family B)
LTHNNDPEFLKEFQKNLIETLFNAKSAEEVEKERFKEAYDYVARTCDRIKEGKEGPKRLVVSKVLRKPVNDYGSMFPHVIAAMQMIQKGKKLRVGENIDFLYINASHTNPFGRVVPASLLDDNQHYDREKYVEMALDVAETVLGLFGFSRKDFGYKPGAKNFIEEIYREREQEVISELQSLVDDAA